MACNHLLTVLLTRIIALLALLTRIALINHTAINELIIRQQLGE